MSVPQLPLTAAAKFVIAAGHSSLREPYRDGAPCDVCGAPIDEDEVPLLLWKESDPDWMLRAHFRCAIEGAG